MSRKEDVLVHDQSGLIYLKFVCVFFMIYTHTTYYLLQIDGHMETGSYLYSQFLFFAFMGVFPLLLPATAGAMLVSRFSGKGLNTKVAKRLPLAKSRGILLTSLGLMFTGLALNWLLYRNMFVFSYYFQSTLQFIALSFLILWLCFVTDYRLLFLTTIAAFVATAFYSDLRFEYSLFWKVLFASDGRQFLWPIFPWVGLISLGAGLQWRKDLFFEPRVRRILLIVSGLASLGLLAVFGLPYVLNPENLWGEGIFQHGGVQAVHFALLYVFFWLLSSWMSERFPPRRYGIVHVFCQAILYVYLFHLALTFILHEVLLRNGYGECLASAGAFPAPCLSGVLLLVYPFVLGSSWLLAWFITRYFMNVRIRVKVRPR